MRKKLIVFWVDLLSVVGRLKFAYCVVFLTFLCFDFEAAPFCLICIWCQHVFIFHFLCDLPPLSKCCYTLTVWLCVLGQSKLHFWDLSVDCLENIWSLCQFWDFCFILMRWMIQLLNNYYSWEKHAHFYFLFYLLFTDRCHILYGTEVKFEEKLITFQFKTCGSYVAFLWDCRLSWRTDQ